LPSVRRWTNLAKGRGIVCWLADASTRCTSSTDSPRRCARAKLAARRRSMSAADRGWARSTSTSRYVHTTTSGYGECITLAAAKAPDAIGLEVVSAALVTPPGSCRRTSATISRSRVAQKNAR
jgi:hypothetical protein